MLFNDVHYSKMHHLMVRHLMARHLMVHEFMAFCGPSSRVCVSYIPQDVLTAPEKVSPTGNGDEIKKRLLEPVAKVSG